MMKRSAFLGLTLALLLCFSASATGAELLLGGVKIDRSMIIAPEADESYTVKVPDVKTDENYVLTVYRGIYTLRTMPEQFSQKGFLYTRSEIATTDTVTFSGIKPKDSANSTVILSGGGQGKPVILGYIKGPELATDRSTAKLGTGNEICVTAVVDNNGTTPCTVNMLLASYKGGKLVGLYLEQVTAPAEDHYSKLISFASHEKPDTIKLFLLGGKTASPRAAVTNMIIGDGAI